MQMGSGIATYARNLNASVRRLGFESQILYSIDREPGKHNLFNEIALLDAARPAASRRVSPWIHRLARLDAPLDRTATWVAPTGEVVTGQFADRAPASDGFWVCRNVFHDANHSYRTWRRFTQVRLGRASQRPDIAHWTCPLPLRASGAANVYTLHDMVPLRLPFATLDNKRRFWSLCRTICRKADRVATVSEHSKQDIVRLLGVEPSRVTVTYQAVELPEALTSRSDAEAARDVEGVFGLDWRGYFIFFGAIEPKKNLARVIEAYLAAKVTAPLLIIGGKSWLDDDETRLLYGDLVEINAVRDGLIRRADRIRRYDYLPFGLLVSLIRGARATLLPSLYEGFGLPVLESMLLGTPVLASTAGSLPEVAGDAALLVDPYDTHAIRKGIEALDDDADLRDELARRGIVQAARFSPEAYRQRLAELYQPLL
jgi:glycosyltransferase involved in cell wall biosynthesis